MEDHNIIKYGDKIALYCNENTKYLTFKKKTNSQINKQQNLNIKNNFGNNNQEEQVRGDGMHPIHQVKIAQEDRIWEEEFIIVNAQNPNYLKGPILFGAQIYLKNKEDEILISSANGSLRMQKPTLEEDVASSLIFKNAKWTIKDPVSDQSKKQVFLYNQVVFQSMYGNYLSVNEETGQANGNAKQYHER
ncbi:hypothetical protein PPERSA_03800 [Pseudocohnilembus persalinus]|uniref:Uncharacterized protein n=1 Tax=Pseudocohnilembus persalinus TaxID=266149 RepID=A0A0V0QUF4_PSEPJ|nr:hypothetical protein PPERSA_03800 [Pseudocohnilembus persalinus]|eukprot:KRX05863.1 hypothetical protein PPERSA_03800 [Pseudocohnilembus persalinus]